MKKNKRKSSLKSTLLLLLLTAILLISSSYAWFTSNRTVTVNTIQVNVAATNGLQISTNASDWKAVISVDEIKTGYTNSTNQVPGTLQPVSTDGSVTAGNMNMFLGVVDSTTGDFLLTSTKETDAQGETGNYVVFDLFFKVDTDTQIYLSSASKVTAAGTEDNKGLQNAARIAFIEEGHSDPGVAAATTQALKNGTTSVIWEPNNNAHTDAAISNAETTYGKTIGSTTVIDSYLGVKSAFSGVALDSEDTNYFAEVTPGIKTGTITTAKNFTTLNAGVTKYRIYMWVEGQDVDCENGASGRDIAFDLKFSMDQD